MRIGILETAYIKKYGLKDGCHLMRTHGYECLDYQKIASADSDFFKSTEADFIKQIKEERTVIEEEGITVNQAHSPRPHPIKEFTKEGPTCFFEAMAKGFAVLRHSELNLMLFIPLCHTALTLMKIPVKCLG